MTQVSEENYFPAIEYLNNLFLYKNKSLEQVFVLSQKLCDDYLNETKNKTLSEPQKKALAEKVLQDNNTTFVQVLGADVDALSRLTLEQIGSKYLFSLWSMAEKTLRRRKSRRTKFKKERLQKQYVETLNHGQFHTVYLTRMNLKKVCSVKFTPSVITYSTKEFSHYTYEYWYVDDWVYHTRQCQDDGWWGQCPEELGGHCDDQGLDGYRCSWEDTSPIKVRRRCCNRNTIENYKKVEHELNTYSCEPENSWAVEMVSIQCTYYLDEYHNYYNLCEIHNGKYFPVKKIKELDNKLEAKYWDMRRKKILLPGDPYANYNHLYYSVEAYTQNHPPQCPNLCTFESQTTVKDDYTGATYTISKPPSNTPQNQTDFNPQPCWEKQKFPT